MAIFNCYVSSPEGIRLLPSRVSRTLVRSYYEPASVWMIYNLKAESVELLNTPMKLVGE